MASAKAAFLFPGQGSQAVGMGRALAERFPEAREAFDRADAILHRPISSLCFEGPDDALRQTAETQPALYTVSMAAMAALGARGIEPGAAAGHSLGEYGALAAAGVFSWEDGLRLVSIRGAAMQRAAGERPGAMAAVMASHDLVEEACRGIEGVVVANINAPEQIVVSGETGAVEALQAKLKEMGVRRVIRLPVSGAFHSPLVAPAVEALSRALADIPAAEPRVPVVANFSAEVVPSADAVRGLLEAQLTGPVRWVECMERLAALGFATFLEVGPGAVLAGLAKRINPEWTVLPCGTPDEIEAAAQALAE